MSNKPNRSRKHSLCVRLNDKEYQEFLTKQKASGLTKQDYVIDAIIHSEITPETYVDELKELNKNFAYYNKQVNGMANNINQLAHKANATDVVDQYAIEDAAYEIRKIRKAGDGLWQSIRSLMATAPRTVQ